MTLKLLIMLAGMGQVALSVASLAIPNALGLRIEANKLRPLVRQVVWTHAAYILCINLSFGLLSLFEADALLDGSRLALLVTGFICIYWAARLVIQFAYFDRSDAPKGLRYSVAEALFVLLFLSLTLIYAAATFHNHAAVHWHNPVQP